MRTIATFSKVPYDLWERDFKRYVFEQSAGWDRFDSEKRKTLCKEIYDDIIVPNPYTVHCGGQMLYAPFHVSMCEDSDVIIPTGITCNVVPFFITDLCGDSYNVVATKLDCTSLIPYDCSEFVSIDARLFENTCGHIIISLRRNKCNYNTFASERDDEFIICAAGCTNRIGQGSVIEYRKGKPFVKLEIALGF